MPRYHFNCADGERDYDRDGTDLDNDQQAQAEAVRVAGEVLKHDPKKVWGSGQWRVEVTNDEGVLLFAVVTIGIDVPRPGAPLSFARTD